jgi:outer membrane protein TolC
MMKAMRTFSLIVLLSLPFNTWAQTDTLDLSLYQLIEIAQSDAPEAQIAQTAMSNNYWRYQSFLSNYKPQIDFSSTLPDLNRSIEAITLPNGQDEFINRSLMTTSVDVGITQNVSLTGGRIFATTGLSRIDIFGTNGNDGTKSYLSTPFSIGFVQPIFGFNDMKWEKIIEPIRYDESKRAYSEDMEQVAYEAANLFFDILIAQLNLEAAQRDKMNSDTLYEISQGRYEVGRIAETELLQIELNVMNANVALAQSSLNLQTSTERLRNYLGINRAIQFKLDPPYDLPDFAIDPNKALDYARNNRTASLAFQRRLIEADREVAEAKGNTGVNMDLFVSFGLSQSSKNLSEAYMDPLDNERLRLGINVPIADWGKAKSALQIAQSNEELVEMRVAQEKVNFEREIMIKVQQFDLVKEQVGIALRAYEIAQKRLDITQKRYRIGKLIVSDLNIAIDAEAAARQSYISALRNYWLAYYDLRRLTLYDFENDKPLVRNVEDIR